MSFTSTTTHYSEADERARKFEAKQASLRAQYEADLRERLKKLDNEHKKQQAQMEAERVREKQAYTERLKQAEILREQQNKFQQLRIEQLDKQISSCKAEIAKRNKSIDDAKLHLKNVNEEYNDKKESVGVLDEKINNFDTYKKVELEKVSTDIQLAEAKHDFDLVEEAIEAAIKSTSVDEDNVARFLTLTQSLLTCTLCNGEQANKLS